MESTKPERQYKIDKRIGKKLKSWREAAGLNQWDVANFLTDMGFPRGRHMISLYECGHNTTPSHIIDALQKYYKIPESEKIMKV